MSEWKECKLRDVGVVVTGKTPSSKSPGDFGHDIPFVTPTDYKNYHKAVSFADRYLSFAGVEKLKNKILPPKSVMVTCIGSDMGKVAINSIPVVTNQQINSIISNSSKVDPGFLYYKLVESYDVLRSYGLAGTAVPIVNKTDFEGVAVLLPPLPEQCAIAGVLSSLDDKIDLLHRQNKTLEGMAEALWRQMFIEEAENEWKVGKLGDFIKTTSGGTPSRSRPDYYENGNYKWVKSKELQGTFIIDTEEKITEEALNNSSAKLLPKDSLLLAMYGATVGEYGILTEQATCNQAVCSLIPNENYPYTFIYMFLRMNKEEIINHAVGSAQQNISQIVIQNFEVFQPNQAIIHFHKSAEGLFDKIKSNAFHIRTLSRLRDTLLPKLMSGKVRVTKEGMV